MTTKPKDHKTCAETHIKRLRSWVKVNGFEIWSEHGEGDDDGIWDGWVNIWCDKCRLTHETNLNPRSPR